MSAPELVTVIITAATALASANALGQALASTPSFDCSKARARSERLICADPQLAGLDRHLSELLASAQQRTNDPGDLRKAQRKWLRERDDCTTTDCIAQSYAQRIESLTTLTGRFMSADAGRLCALFEQPDTRAATLSARLGVEDVNNDGEADTADSCAASAELPCQTYVDRRNRPLAIQPLGFEWNAYSALGRAPFRFEGRTYLYHSHDAALADPSHISFVTPENHEVRVCDFETRQTSVTLEGGDDVCDAVASGEGIEPIDLTNAEGATSRAEGVTFSRADTVATASGSVDIDNDGLDEALLELRYQRAIEPDCTFNYYELLADDQHSLLDNSNSTPVRELQRLTEDSNRERGCGNITNRLFKFADRVYYEANRTHGDGWPHEVRKLDGRAVATLCTFEREAITKVKTLY